MDLHYRKRANKFRFHLIWWWAITCANAILLSANSANAQLVGDLLLDDIAINNQRLEGAEFQIDLPDGTRCLSHHGSPPHLSFYGGSSQRDDRHKLVTSGKSSYNSGGLAAGAVLVIPFGSRTNRNCDRSYELHLLSKKLDLATILFEQGLISEEEMGGLIQEAKKLLDLSQSSNVKKLD